MSESTGLKFFKDRKRPPFPKRAIVTGGMPYGNKDLHFGHIGGVFVQADTFAQFLRDRLGAENVIFVSGTDCYGSPIIEDHRRKTESGDFKGDVEAFVRANHEKQTKTLEAYHVKPNLFAGSGLGRAKEIHAEYSRHLFETLYRFGHLEKRTTAQFYDEAHGMFLNGRQVIGYCPVKGCKSEKGYADECDLGHQYEPKALIAPKSTLTGEPPQMRETTNWYLRLPAFREKLSNWVKGLRERNEWRSFILSTMEEQFEPPTIHITKNQIDTLQEVIPQLPPHVEQEGSGKSLQLVFESLEQMDEATSMLAARQIRYRTGKTLVPFRLTGNVVWGVPVPEIEGAKDLTFWVWPESLWAPISFTMAYLEKAGRPTEEWKSFWCSKDARVFQFIGEDNITFYGLPEMAMFLGMQGEEPNEDPPEGELQLPTLIANCHIQFLGAKASSSGQVKPPMACDLLEYYTSDQLRAHFFSLGLGMRSISFQPKPLNPGAHEKEADPVLKEGNLLSNAFNRAVRSCFYTAQKFYDGLLPQGEVSSDVLKQSEKVILDFEEAMYQFAFHTTLSLIGDYIRDINQSWSKSKPFAEDCSPELRKQALLDTFHMVRVATVLLHPIAPTGTEKIREYLQVGEVFWDWNRIFEPIHAFVENPAEHKLKFLEPRVDFFEKHPSQVKD